MNFRIRCTALCLLTLASLFPVASTAAAQTAPTAKPTVAEALAFIASAEKELSAMSIDAARASWVEETYITDDTVALVAEANDRLIARQTELIDEARRFDGLTLPPDAARKLLLLKLSIGLPAPTDPNAARRDHAEGRRTGRCLWPRQYCPDADPDHCLGIDDIDSRWPTAATPRSWQPCGWAGTQLARRCAAITRGWPS